MSDNRLLSVSTISVFRTSVISRKDIEALRPYLDNALPGKWNFDLEDCDKILRVDSKNKVSGTVIKLLQENGFSCEELTD